MGKKGEKTVPPFTIKHRGFFNQVEVVKAIQDWMDGKGYYVNINFFKQSSGKIGQNYYIEMQASRALNEYVKFHIHIIIRIYDMKEVELIKEGKKTKTNQGHFHANIRSKIKFDWQERFKGNKFLIALGDFLREHILKYKISDYWAGKMVHEMQGLLDTINNTLGRAA